MGVCRKAPQFLTGHYSCLLLIPRQIWLITLVMSSMGMTAGLVAGVISALSTYTVQSITALDPIFTITAATTLRGSVWLRSSEASEFLRDPLKGRARVFVVQLQGHLFLETVLASQKQSKRPWQRKGGQSCSLLWQYWISPWLWEWTLQQLKRLSS